MLNRADEDAPTVWNAGIEPLQTMLQGAADNGPPIPAIQPHREFEDGTKPKTNAGIEKLATPDYEGPSIPGIVFADSSITQKWPGSEATKGSKSRQSTSPLVSLGAPPSPPPTQTEGNGLNQELSSPNQEVGITNWLHSLAPITEEVSNLPRSVNNALAPTNDRHQDEDDKEDAIVIPEAFLVEANAPEDASIDDDVVIGTPMELDPQPSWHEQRRTKLMLAAVCFILVVFTIALGLSLSRPNNTNDGSVEKVIYNTVMVEKTSPPTLSLAPSSTPSLTQSPSDVPSLIPTASPSSSPSVNPSVSPAPSISNDPSLFPSLTPSVSKYPSSLPTVTSLPTAQKEAVFDVDCDDDCWPMVAIRGDTVVVTRNEIDIQFFIFANNNNFSISFEPVTRINIDYPVSSVATDGNTAVIGSISGNGQNGSCAYVYEKDQDGIWYLKDILKPRDFNKGDDGEAFYISNGTMFGRSVAVNNDIIIVGADDDGELGEGSAYIFRRNQTAWIEEVKLIAPRLSEGYGYSVSINGNVAVVSDIAYGNYQEGAVFIYEYESVNNSWNKSVINLLDENCFSYFGSFVRLTYDDGLLVGCDGNNVTHYYEKKVESSGANEYILKQNITFDNYLSSIDVDGDTMVTSETRTPISNLLRFFVRRGHVWEQFNKIDEPNFDSSFGYSVALSGNVTLIASAKNVYRV
jgi:hypothetical protein